MNLQNDNEKNSLKNYDKYGWLSFKNVLSKHKLHFYLEINNNDFMIFLQQINAVIPNLTKPRIAVRISYVL